MIMEKFSNTAAVFSNVLLVEVNDLFVSWGGVVTFVASKN